MTDIPSAAHRFRQGLVTSTPLILGYFPIAFSFGVAAVRTGLTTAEAIMISVVIFAGAAQFLVLALVASGAPFFLSLATLVAMNLRHVMYGPVLMEKAGEAGSSRWSFLWGWCLTDEVFGAALGAMARGERFSEAFVGGIGLGAYLSWIAGTALGAVSGAGALEAFPAVNAGFSFMLPALFLALLLSILDKRQISTVAAAALATIAGLTLFSPSVGILAGMAAGALAGMIKRRHEA